MFSQPILAACNLETETVIKTPDQHCLLPGDTVSLNGVRSQVFKAGPDYFVVSGDGLLHEIYNGLFERDDWRFK